RKWGSKAIETSWKEHFLRKQQSGAAGFGGTRGGQIEQDFALRAEHGAHGPGGLLFLLLLRMAVGALQKARVRVPYQIRHCLLVHA
ncbi:hypothetical protein LEFCBN_LEFCBN_07580, partial [Dysosmobacter welbionis]